MEKRHIRSDMEATRLLQEMEKMQVKATAKDKDSGEICVRKRCNSHGADWTRRK